MNNEIQEVLNQVVFNPKARASVNYAMARCAIERAFDGHNAATNRKNRRAAKMVVVNHFNGKLVHETEQVVVKPRTRVVFPDNSKAIF